MNIDNFVNELNNKSYVMLEGKINYDVNDVNKIINIFSKFKTIDEFIKLSSLKQKMEIAYFLNNGKYKEISNTYISDLEQILNLNGTCEFLVSMILADYVGYIKGIITINPIYGALRKEIDIMKLEKELNILFNNLLFNNNNNTLIKSKMFKFIVKEAFNEISFVC